MVDLFGVRAKAELEAVRASHLRIDEVRQQEINRLGQLLNSTIMKLLALTDKDAARLVASREGVQPEQKPVPSSAFMRRMNPSAAMRTSKELQNGPSE